MQIYIKNKTRRKDEFQFFMHDFVDACKENGFISKPDLIPSYRWHFRALLREILFFIYLFIHKYFPLFINRKKALLIAANGSTIKDIAFPYYGSYEIVPMLWDVWPYSWDRMIDSFKNIDIKTVLVSSSQMARYINNETETKAYWIPEALTIEHYEQGSILVKRENDVFEMGRQLPAYHAVLMSLYEKGKLRGYKTSNLNSDGTLNDRKVAYTNDELYKLMSVCKIMVCFPQCDTNPKRAGSIETLTQRFWEAMLSGCLMIGRAPKELIDFIGYNPVIDVDWNNPERQLLGILGNIIKYQQLVDRNVKVAKQKASWKSRMALIKKCLRNAGYDV